YARAGLVSDVEVIDDYPSHFTAYSRRKHRWVRGDWQIMLWLLPRVRDYFGRMTPNPLSVISRWKILDKLRRSLVERSTFGLAVTRRRLREWETAAQAETGAVRRTPVDLYLGWTPWLSAVIAAALAEYRPGVLPVASPVLVLWACAKPLSQWLNRPLLAGKT